MNDLKLTSANIVVLANTFNPSIAAKDWLLEHVMGAEPTDFLSTPFVSAYKTDKLELLVDQSRLQVTCKEKEVDDEVLRACADAVVKYVTKLPHTPYTAIGLNYVWESSPCADNMAGPLCRQFAEGLHNLAEEFSEYSVGTTIVGRRQDALIRLSVEPSLDSSKPLTVKVNYHYDCSGSQHITDRAKGFFATGDEAARIARSILFEEKAHVSNG